jgi:predicted N-formylglutamate amidohydrolase
MDAEGAFLADSRPSIAEHNRDGKGQFVIVCDHASNNVPPDFGGLGLEAADLLRHIAYDPGALGVAKEMSRRLDAPLVCGGVSRLVIDCNRPLDASDLIAEISETTAIPGNAGLTQAERDARILQFYDPFHAAVASALSRKTSRGLAPGVIAVHSFNPSYKGVSRPWEIAIIHDDDDAWAQGIVDRLRALGGLAVGVNQPYSPKDRVYHTLERHARSRGLPAVMIEVRNDEIADEKSQQRWGGLLAGIVDDAYREMNKGVADAKAAGA